MNMTFLKEKNKTGAGEKNNNNNSEVHILKITSSSIYLGNRL